MKRKFPFVLKVPEPWLISGCKEDSIIFVIGDMHDGSMVGWYFDFRIKEWMVGCFSTLLYDYEYIS